MKISQSILARILFSTSLTMLLSACPPTEGPSKRTIPGDATIPGDGVSHVQSPLALEAKTAFEAKGISVPDTTMTAADNTRAAKLDLARIREAIAQAKILSEKEVEDIEKKASGSQDEVRPTNVRARDDDDHAENEQIESPPPAPKGMAAPVMKMETAISKTPAKMDHAPLTRKKKMKSAEEKPEKPQKTVLKQITSQAREAKVLVRNEEGKLVPLIARETRLVTYIQGPRARTVVDTVFENMTDHQLQGTFYFPLPADSSPVGFAMFSAAISAETAKAFAQGKSLPKLPDNSFLAANMDDYAPSHDESPAKIKADWQRRQEARVVEQKRARQVYEKIVRQQVDPALLEWSGGNNFQARVYPIEPKSLKRVVLVYEQTLPFDGSLLRYTFPLPEKKAVVPLTARVHIDGRHGLPKAVAMGKDLRTIVPKGKDREGWKVFDLVQEEAGGALTVALAPKGRHHVLVGSDPGGLPGRPFFAKIRPDLPSDELGTTGRAILLVDTSLSAEDGKAYELQSGMLEALLQKDDSIQEYAILLFDIRPRWLHAPGWRKNGEENRKETFAELRKVYLEGATNFDAVLTDLDKNMTWINEGGKKAVAFLLSDGQITWGQTRSQKMLKLHPAAKELRWICYRFGENAINQNLFDSLVRVSDGQVVTILSPSEIPAAAQAHRHSAAKLLGLEVKGVKVEDLTIAGDPKLLFPGQELKIAGRLIGDGVSQLVVNAMVNGKKKEFSVELPAKAKDRMAARAFGELFTNRLLALDDERLDRMIVALSQHYLLANARSSMLILKDESAYTAFGIKNETVELTNLERLRRQEEDKRMEKLLALDLDDASPLARDLVRAMREAGGQLAAPLRPQPLVDRPWSGGETRLQAELLYRKERKKEKMDVLVYDAIARARALAGDTMGAVRALSCTVELRPEDTEATRLVGYALLALGQYEPAAELFERARLKRPFEGQVFLEEALALDGAGRLDEAARRYEIVLSRSWRRHEHEIKTVATYHYRRLLEALLRERKMPENLRSLLAKRTELLRQLTNEGSIDYQLTTHWSTDGIDIDLWVIEPDGTKCYYGHQETQLGGKLHWDITDGLGPELYHMRKAAKGEYLVLVHYYGNNSPRLAVPTSLLLIADRDVFGPEDRYTRRIQMRMLPKTDAVLELRREKY